MSAKRTFVFGVKGIALITVLFLLATARPSVAQAASSRPNVEDFFDAIALDRRDVAMSMLESNTNLARSFNNFSKRPLLEAAAAGNVALVKRLLELGADINIAGDILMSVGAEATALHVAIRHNRPAVCKFLLEAGADPTRMAFGFVTPLHLAFTEHRSETAGWLLDYGADPFAEKGFVNDKTTPFETEITKNDGKLVPRMLGQTRPGPTALKPIRALPWKKSPDATRQAIARMIANHGPELLKVAAQRGELEAVSALFKAGVSTQESPEERGALLRAFAVSEAATARGPQFDSARWLNIRNLLLKNGATYDAFAATALGDLEQARRLYSADKTVALSKDRDGLTLLHWAVQNQQLELTAFWLGAGALPSATNSAGETALHIACERGLVEHSKLLLAAPTPTTIRDTNGWTALDRASRAQQAETIRLFLSQKGAPAQKDRALPLSIHEAAASGNVDALSALTEKTNHLEARNELGLTPLQVAVQQGHLAAAALLVSKGADINARDAQGDTLLHWVIPHLFGYSIRDRPPTNWFARVPQTERREAYLRALAPREYGRGPEAVLEATVFLLASGIDARATNHAGLTPVQIAADEKTPLFDDRAPLLKLLAGSGGKIDAADANGNTPLHLAGKDTIVDRMASLIASGADLNATNRQGRTPLHVYCENISSWDESGSNDNQPFQLLVKSRPNVNAQDNDGLTPLHILVGSESSFRSRATRLLLDAGAKPNLRDKLGRTALHVVAANPSPFEKANLTRALLDAGADPNARDNLGRVPIHILLSQKWPWREAGECITALVGAGADLSARDNEGKTPLHYLAALGNQGVLFFLRGVGDVFTKAKVDLQAHDNNGDTPAHIAVRTGTRDVFDWLAKQGADLDATNSAGETPRLMGGDASRSFAKLGPPNAETDLCQAAREGNVAAATRLLKANPAVLNQADRLGHIPLREAILSRQTNMIEFLEKNDAQWDAISAVLAARIDVLGKVLRQQPGAISTTIAGESLFHLAVDSGNPEITKLLLATGGDLRAADAWGLSPLGRARFQQRKGIEQFFRDHGLKENLFDAVYVGDVKTVSTLLSRDKSQISMNNSNGASPLEVAAGIDQVGVINVLLDKGALVNQINPRDGMTPLHVAAIFNQTNAVRLLLRRGAKTEAIDRSGFTPLHLAALHGSSGAAELLLAHKANANSTILSANSAPFSPRPPFFNWADNTPLHLAAMNAHANVIQLLIKAHAAVNATNSNRRTPLDLATRRGLPPWDHSPQTPSIRPAVLADTRSMSSEDYTLARARRQAAVALIEAAGGKRSNTPRQPFEPPF